MAKPVLMALATWLRRTSRFGHKRSTELLFLDTYLGQFHKATGSPSDLEVLAGAMTVWVQKKALGTLDRDKSSAVTDLGAQITLATTLRPALQSFPAYPGLMIGNDDSRGRYWVPATFLADARAALVDIASQPVGLGLLTAISAACVQNGHRVTIEYSGAGAMAAPLANPSDVERKKIQKVAPDSPTIDVAAMLALPELRAILGVWDGVNPRTVAPNTGTSAAVTWNPADPGPPGFPRPSFVGLAHELIHALHYVSGTCYRSATGALADLGNSGLMEEEMRTVGLFAYANEVPSENAIRAEHGIGLRTSYMAGVSFDNVTHSLRS